MKRSAIVPRPRCGGRRPASIPERIAPPASPAHYEIRRIRRGGEFRFRGRLVFVSSVLAGCDMGLEEILDGVWNLVYYATVLGRFDERSGTVTAG